MVSKWDNFKQDNLFIWNSVGVCFALKDTNFSPSSFIDGKEYFIVLKPTAIEKWSKSFLFAIKVIQ